MGYTPISTIFRSIAFAILGTLLLISVSGALLDHSFVHGFKQRMGFHYLIQTGIPIQDYTSTLRWATKKQAFVVLPIANLHLVGRPSSNLDSLQVLIFASQRSKIIPFDIVTHMKGWFITPAIFRSDDTSIDQSFEAEMASSTHTTTMISAPILGVLHVPSSLLEGANAILTDPVAAKELVQIWEQHHVNHVGLWILTEHKFISPQFFIHPTTLSTATLVDQAQTAYPMNGGLLAIALILWLISWIYIWSMTMRPFIVSCGLSGVGLWWWFYDNSLLHYHTLPLPLVNLSLIWGVYVVGSYSIYILLRKRLAVDILAEDTVHLPPMTFEDEKGDE